jgi:uncharacterized protein YjbI with pentapeptide repeats
VELPDAQSAPNATPPDITEGSLTSGRPTAELKALRSAFKRAMTREPPPSPFAGKQLGRAEVERVIAVNAETGSRHGIDLRGADLRGADLSRLDLTGARLGDDDPLATEAERTASAANLDGAQLIGANLVGAILAGASLVGANLRGANLEEANLMGAHLIGAYLSDALLVGARCTEVILVDAQCENTHFDDAILVGAKLMGANLRGAHLEGADLGLAQLDGTDLRQAFCSERTYLGGALFQGALIDGLRLHDVDLTVVDWERVRTIGEEFEAKESLLPARPAAFRATAHSYRRLGLALRAQGLTAEGNRFTARARYMEERALAAETRIRWQGRRVFPAIRSAWRWVRYAIQGAVTAYGERPARALFWLAGVFVICAVLFMLISPGHPTFGTALLLSGSALLGRGYAAIPQAVVAPGWSSLLAILEAGVGTVLELLFVLALARKTLS